MIKNPYNYISENECKEITITPLDKLINDCALDKIFYEIFDTDNFPEISLFDEFDEWISYVSFENFPLKENYIELINNHSFKEIFFRFKKSFKNYFDKEMWALKNRAMRLIRLDDQYEKARKEKEEKKDVKKKKNNN